MWTRPLNNTALATATHRKSKWVSDGTDTQVKTQMINKCRMMTQRGLYNGKDPPSKGERERGKEREREREEKVKKHNSNLEPNL